MAGAIELVAGFALLAVGCALGLNYRGVGLRVAVFGGALTFMFGGGQILRQPQRAYRMWGTIIGLMGVVIGLAGVANLAGA